MFSMRNTICRLEKQETLLLDALTRKNSVVITKLCNTVSICLWKIAIFTKIASMLSIKHQALNLVYVHTKINLGTIMLQ